MLSNLLRMTNISVKYSFRFGVVCGVGNNITNRNASKDRSTVILSDAQLETDRRLLLFTQQRPSATDNNSSLSDSLRKLSAMRLARCIDFSSSRDLVANYSDVIASMVGVTWRLATSRVTTSSRVTSTRFNAHLVWKHLVRYDLEMTASEAGSIV